MRYKITTPHSIQHNINLVSIITMPYELKGTTIALQKPQNGAHNWTRTSDLSLTKGVLYHLSYVGNSTITNRTTMP